MPPRLLPRAGPVGQRFTLILAASGTPPHLRYEIEARRPGERGFRLYTFSAETQVQLDADAGRGRYSYRVRVLDPATGVSGGWSPAVVYSAR